MTRGEVDLYCSDIPGALGLLQGDKVTALGITSRKRSPTLPDIPPFAEAGPAELRATGYVGIMVTGGTPAAVIGKLNTAINEVVREPEFAKRFAAFGYEMVGGTRGRTSRPSSRGHRALSRADAGRRHRAGIDRGRCDSPIRFLWARASGSHDHRGYWVLRFRGGRQRSGQMKLVAAIVPVTPVMSRSRSSASANVPVFAWSIAR